VRVAVYGPKEADREFDRSWLHGARQGELEAVSLHCLRHLAATCTVFCIIEDVVFLCFSQLLHDWHVTDWRSVCLLYSVMLSDVRLASHRLSSRSHINPLMPKHALFCYLRAVTRASVHAWVCVTLRRARINARLGLKALKTSLLLLYYYYYYYLCSAVQSLWAWKLKLSDAKGCDDVSCGVRAILVRTL